MATPPYEFDKLGIAKGQPIRTALSARWFALLARTMKAICPVAADGGFVVIQYTPAGAVIGLTRDVGATIYARADGSGITAKNAVSGAWGGGYARLYYSVNDEGVDMDVLETEPIAIRNRRTFSAPGNADLLLEAVDGDDFLIDYVRP